MDEQANQELTRTPDGNDLVTLARELNRLGVAYMVVGGFAINRLGLVRATEDIDLLIAKDKANQALVKKALEICGTNSPTKGGGLSGGDYLFGSR